MSPHEGSVKQVSPVGQLLGEFKADVEALERSVEILRERLHMVLHQEPPSKSEVAIPPPCVANSVVYMEFGGLRSRVVAVVISVSNMLERLEV